MSSVSTGGIDEEGTKKIIQFILAMPNGVYRMSEDISGLIETSNNLASVKLEERGSHWFFHLLTTQRSSNEICLMELTQKVQSLAQLAGAKAINSDAYPSWHPNMDSPLLKKCVAVHNEMYQKEPIIEIIHAGLECGVIGSKYPNMDMLSFGPTIKNPHSPTECVHIKSVTNTEQLLSKILDRLSC